MFYKIITSQIPVYHLCHYLFTGSELLEEGANACLYTTFYTLIGENTDPNARYLERAAAYVYGFYPDPEVIYSKTQVGINDWWLRLSKRSDNSNLLVKMKW